MTNAEVDASLQSAGELGTVGALFRARATVCASTVAVEHRGRHVSYGELLDRVTRASAMLAALGLTRGDRVALLSRNRPEYIEIELAAACLGVITACLNWRLSPRELAYCIESRIAEAADRRAGPRRQRVVHRRTRAQDDRAR